MKKKIAELVFPPVTCTHIYNYIKINSYDCSAKPAVVNLPSR